MLTLKTGQEGAMPEFFLAVAVAVDAVERCRKPAGDLISSYDARILGEK
jgi:hypothetical protein